MGLACEHVPSPLTRLDDVGDFDTLVLTNTAARTLPNPAAKRAQRSTDLPLHRPELSRLAAINPSLKYIFDFFLTLEPGEMNSFSGTDWARYIIVVILALRLSFPLPGCLGWRDGWARREIGFGECLDRLCEIREGDVLSASKVVLRVMKRKWEKKAARFDRRLEEQVEREITQQEFSPHVGGFPVDGMVPLSGLELGDPMMLDKSMQGCPMTDGSMDSYVSLWDESFGTAAGSSSILSGMAVDVTGTGTEAAMPAPAEYPDLWGTMTMGWAGQWLQPGFEFDQLNL